MTSKSAKNHAEVECRSISAQIKYWAKLGKAALENPDLPGSFINDILVSREFKTEAGSFKFR